MHYWTASGAVLGALGVITGAFGAHALRDRLSPQALGWWETAVHYQFVHALALLVLGLGLAQLGPSRPATLAGAGFLAGALLFSGSLYAMALGAPRWFGAITPIGGLAWIAAWLLFAWHALSRG